MNSGCITENGVVAGRSDQVLEIRLSASDACARCGLCSRGEDGGMFIKVKAPSAPLEIGGHVRVTLPYRSVWKQSFFVFVLPLFLMLCGTVLASLTAPGASVGTTAATLIAVAGALVGLGAGVLAAIAYEARFRKHLWENTKVEPLAGS